VQENHPVVTHDEWIAARKELLAEEKEFTRSRDELSRRRRDLPWERVEKEYVFEGPDGTEALADLFDGRSQLVVYHFMFDPKWDAGCNSVSPKIGEREGLSVFYRSESGEVFHTYSAYARGIDMVNTAYHYLDLVPKGRMEELGWGRPQEWVRRRDEYER
jgi:predicted dithiol-disulfide oxidoreductase (DUF899 family)